MEAVENAMGTLNKAFDELLPNIKEQALTAR
jgi:hypothetical protein